MRKTRGGWGETGRRSHIELQKSRASYFRFARFNTSPLYYLRAWHWLRPVMTKVRLRSDTYFFMTRTLCELRPTQILFRPAELIQTLILIATEPFSLKVEKWSFRSKCVFYNNLWIAWKVRRLNQSRSKGEIPSRARRKRTAESFQTETGVPNSFRRRTFHVLNSTY